MKLRADAKLKSQWAQTAAIRRTIYDMAQKKETAPGSHELPAHFFNEMIDPK